jgi:hypothetical protein
MIDPLLQERIDDFKKDLIEVCKRHRMTIGSGTRWSEDGRHSYLAIVGEVLPKVIEEAEWSEWDK